MGIPVRMIWNMDEYGTNYTSYTIDTSHSGRLYFTSPAANHCQRSRRVDIPTSLGSGATRPHWPPLTAAASCQGTVCQWHFSSHNIPQRILDAKPMPVRGTVQQLTQFDGICSFCYKYKIQTLQYVQVSTNYKFLVNCWNHKQWQSCCKATRIEELQNLWLLCPTFLSQRPGMAMSGCRLRDSTNNEEMGQLGIDRNKHWILWVASMNLKNNESETVGAVGAVGAWKPRCIHNVTYLPEQMQVPDRLSSYTMRLNYTLAQLCNHVDVSHRKLLQPEHAGTMICNYCFGVLSA